DCVTGVQTCALPICIGQARPCVTAFINIDLAAVGSWAERRNIAYTSYGDFAQKPGAYELIRGEVEGGNVRDNDLCGPRAKAGGLRADPRRSRAREREPGRGRRLARGAGQAVPD